MEETTEFLLFYLAHGRHVNTLLDAILRQLLSDHSHEDAEVVSNCVKPAQLGRIMIQNRQSVDANRYGLRQRDTHLTPGDQVLV
ncbi:hypothetical protein HPB48_004198 [Haemaphysalis longicornis]|uniref:Uncharacterized protein n=1 Tax=Haemaphysalis longicornis TaxID=44386 RepID=A0A9J6GU27_HAELO|nr:hypothetical protein HPB48_004198 [Haemaphysalis longicornis]